MTVEAVTFGEAMLLLLAEPGVPLAAASVFHRSVAGAESNVAIALARLGHRSRWIGSIGDDPAGQAVLRQIRAEGVDCDFVRVDPHRPTGLLLRDSFPRRTIEVQYARAGSAAAHVGPVPGEALHGARVLHVSGITPMLSPAAHHVTNELVADAKRLGVAVSVDPNVRLAVGAPEQWSNTVTPLLGHADLVFAGEGELRMLTGLPAAEAVRRLHGAGVDTVVTRAADRSATASTGEGTWHQPAFTVPAVDPVGAGDAFAAGYLSGWLRGLPPASCLTEGAAVAALSVQAANDIDGLPDANQRERALGEFRGQAGDVLR